MPTVARWLLILLLTSFSSDTFATTFYVKPTATGLGTGATWANASSDPQAMIDGSASGDEVWVTGGTYQPKAVGSPQDRRFKMKEGVKIYGGFAGTENILADRDLTVTDNKSTLLGNSDATTTVYSDNNLSNASLLNGFTIKGSSVGIYNYGASPSFVNLIITGGSTGSAPAVLIRMHLRYLQNCAIVNNPGNVMTNNASYPILTNCTIAGNIFNGGGFGMQNTSSYPKIRNSIIFGNSSGISNDANSVPAVTYSLVQGENNPDPATHNVPEIVNPKFEDAAGGDYRLSPCSPAINKGSNTYYMNDQTPDISNVSKDLVGENRFYSDGIVDMGAFEQKGIASEGVASVWYVRAGAMGSGMSWHCPTGDLQLAIDAAANGEQVWVAGGTLRPTVNFDMKEGVKIYGGVAGTEASLAARDLTMVANQSILRADEHVVLYNSALTLTTAAVLDGFTIRGSRTSPGIINDSGSSPILSNLSITEHTGYGGMRIFSSSPVLVNCSFTGNRGGDGAGIFIASASPILVNCLIKGNTATGGGGGICVSTSTASITNCTIVGNTAAGQGGGIFNRGTSPLLLRNSIVYGNNTGLANLSPPEITSQYSLVQGIDTPNSSDHNLPGNTNPLFVDAAAGNYRLQPCSPLVNTGFNYFKSGSDPDLSGIASDLDVNARMRESAVDMGAYEFSGASRALAVDGDVAASVVNGDFILTTNGAGGCRLLAYVSPGRTDVTGFSGFFVKTIETALPLNLISFTATHEAGNNLLQWSTTSEINTDHFEVQSSPDAKNFIKIATVDAAGSGDLQYRYNDRTNYGGTIYYRLKMSDRAANRRDNTFTYSKIISLTGDENFAAIYPNPARAMVTFKVSDALLNTTANLYDMSGRRIQSIIITGNKQQINVKTLASGLYISKFANGAADRFVKN